MVEHTSKAEYLSAASDPATVAWGNFTNEIETTGWSYLEVTASPQFADAVQVGDLLGLLKNVARILQYSKILIRYIVLR